MEKKEGTVKRKTWKFKSIMKDREREKKIREPHVWGCLNDEQNPTENKKWKVKRVWGRIEEAERIFKASKLSWVFGKAVKLKCFFNGS